MNNAIITNVYMKKKKRGRYYLALLILKTVKKYEIGFLFQQKAKIVSFRYNRSKSPKTLMY